MKRNFLKDEWLQIVILVAPFILMAAIWNHIPDIVPMHWGGSGKPNGYASKGPGLFILPVINIAVAALLFWISRIDPKAYQMKLPGESVRPIRLAITAFLSAIVCVSVIPSLAMNLNGMWIDSGVGILIFVLGNYLPRVKPNYFVGIRTPWALENPENWRLTHQFGGRVWVIASTIFIILSFFIPAVALNVLLFLFIAVIVIIPFVYSYILFQKSKRIA